MSLSKAIWRTTQHGAKLYFSSRTYIELIVLGKLTSLVAFDKFGVVGKDLQNRECFTPSNNQRYRATHSSIDTVIHFPLTMFQILTMTVLPL